MGIVGTIAPDLGLGGLEAGDAVNGSVREGLASKESVNASYETSLNPDALRTPLELVVDGLYRCPRPDCKRKFSLKAALHTHIGWHKRKDNQASGVYERLAHPSKTTVYRKDPTSGEMIASEIFRCGEEGCNKTFKTRGALSTHQGHHKRVRNPKRSRVEAAAQPTVNEANRNRSHTEAANTSVDKAPAPPSPFMQRPAALVMATHATQTVGTLDVSTPIGITGSSAASYAVGVGHIGSQAQALQSLGLPYSASGETFAWGPANDSQNQFGTGQWARPKLDTGSSSVSSCDEVEACFPTSPLVAPPAHVSVPLTGPDDTSQPSWDQI